jgi:transposase
MGRYKPVDARSKFIAIDLGAQLLPGTFEHTLNHLLEQAIDLRSFDARYRNDTTEAPAYAPAMLLRVVLFAYSRCIISSRTIARACEEQATFIALRGDSRPHFAIIAHFVNTTGEQISRIFAAVLTVCDRQGLIGREMFAIDGVKLPSNASKHRRGTRADAERQAEKFEMDLPRKSGRVRDKDYAASCNCASYSAGLT